MYTFITAIDGASKADKLLTAKGEIFQLRQTLRRMERENAKQTITMKETTNKTIKTFTHAFSKMTEAKHESDGTVYELRDVIARMKHDKDIMCRNHAYEIKELQNNVATLESAAQKNKFDLRVPPAVLPPNPPRSTVNTLRLSSITTIT